MKNLLHDPECPKIQQNPKLAVTASDSKNHDAKAALSDDDLGLVSAAGTPSVPTVNVEVLLGRHNIPTDTEERRP